MIDDIKKFISKFKFDQEVMDEKKLNFRLSLLIEEFNEVMDAHEDSNAEEFVDGHIDLIVIAIGNLQLLGVDVDKAWQEVMRANMSKERGIKSTRPGSGGFDVIKPKDWKAPSHKDNHGKLSQIFEGEA